MKCMNAITNVSDATAKRISRESEIEDTPMFESKRNGKRNTPLKLLLYVILNIREKLCKKFH